MKKTSQILTLLFIACAWSGARAANDAQQTFAGYEIVYSAFNSSFISPEVAATYHIIRGKDRGLVNIAVLKRGADVNIGGKPALVTGYVSNILGQRQQLAFVEVNEGTATYYLAPFRFQNEDFMTFKIRVQQDPDKPADELSFQRTFYRDR
tara:strand:- start:2652 stop:3104 length:453 start_codon:yes stop_codon:yes gene_type:complete